MFSLLNNPLFAPPHSSGAQEPCQPIDALPPPLLQEPHQPIDDLPRLLLHFLSRQARAGLAIIITLIFCVDVKWQNSQQPSLFPKLLLWHWQITRLSFWKHPVVIVETFKVKVYLAVSRHFPAQPFCPVLVLAFAWSLFSSLHLHLAPFLGSLIVLQFQYWSSKFWKSTVLDFAKPFGWICFFCYIALLILSPRLHLKERVVA